MRACTRVLHTARTTTKIHDASDHRLFGYRLARFPKRLREAGLFVAESRQVISRLLCSRRFNIQSLLCTPGAFESLHKELEPYPQLPIFSTESRIINELTQVGRGCVALVDRPERATLLSELLEVAAEARAPWRICALEEVTDPDNIGGIFRSAQAFGFGGALLSCSSGDPFYRKAVRTSMAATLSIPFAQRGDGASLPTHDGDPSGWCAGWRADLQQLKANGYRLVALTPDAPRCVDTVATELKDERVALLLGNEGLGLRPQTLALADERVSIRMAAGFAGSLNVMAAASVAMHRFAVVE